MLLLLLSAGLLVRQSGDSVALAFSSPRLGGCVCVCVCVGVCVWHAPRWLCRASPRLLPVGPRPKSVDQQRRRSAVARRVPLRAVHRFSLAATEWSLSLSLSLFFFPPRLADSERSFVEISVCVLPIFVHCLTFFISPPPKRCFLRSDRRPLSDVNRVNGVNSSSTWHRTTNRIRRPCFLNRLAQSIYQV